MWSESTQAYTRFWKAAHYVCELQFKMRPMPKALEFAGEIFVGEGERWEGTAVPGWRGDDKSIEDSTRGSHGVINLRHGRMSKMPTVCWNSSRKASSVKGNERWNGVGGAEEGGGEAI
eukprot:jgi/Undpi1/525/HiC_scaffold_10.g03989.m1